MSDKSQRFQVAFYEDRLVEWMELPWGSKIFSVDFDPASGWFELVVESDDASVVPRNIAPGDMVESRRKHVSVVQNLDGVEERTVTWR